jgi:uncharacterized protein YndB with AHSA1/START domain
MTVTTISRDSEQLTMSITSEFVAPIGRVWQMWQDPRLLERWWGPPTYPATFVRHDLRPGGRMSYFMTGPEGDRPHGWWRVTALEEPRRIEFENGLATADGEPDERTPAMNMTVTLSEHGGGVTRMEITAAFPSVEAMEMFLTMGMEEGMAGALGQIDALLG